MVTKTNLLDRAEREGILVSCYPFSGIHVEVLTHGTSSVSTVTAQTRIELGTSLTKSQILPFEPSGEVDRSIRRLGEKEGGRRNSLTSRWC
jgi:hypothetical protein